MATYNTAFGSLPGYNEMLGTTNTTGGGQQQTYNQQGQTSQPRQPAQAPQTFAQLQRQGMARPAPVAPQARSFQQYGGSQQGQQMRQRLQQQLESFGNQPSRYDTQAFQQIRGAQSANLQAEYQAQQKALNEDLARRGLSASSIGGGRMGDLAGQQSRALADLDARLLQQAAETQAQDRAQLLAAGQGLAELAGAQDLSQFEANRVAQAAEFENQLRAAQFGQQQYEQGTQQAFQAAQAEQGASQFEMEQGLRQVLGLGGLGLQQRQQLAQEQQFGATQAEQQRQFNIQQALQAQLGLGNLSLEQQRVAAQQQQFGQSLEEQRAGRLQQYGITQQELGLRSQQLQQEAQLQGRQLSIQEAQNQAQNSLERDRMAQQGQQFGLQLGETQAARLQQYGLSVQELGLRSQQIQQEAQLQGRQLSIQEAQNLAQNGLEQQRITQQAQQFGLSLNEQQAARLQQGGFTAQELGLKAQQIAQEGALQGRQLTLQERQNEAINLLERDKLNADRDFRSQQLGLNRDELNLRADQIKEDQRLRGVEIDNEQAYRQAETELRATQIVNEYTRSGQQIDLDTARLQAQQDMANADNNAQMARLEKQIGAQASESSFERDLRRQLGMSETTGYVLDANGNVVRDTSGNPILTVQGRSALAQQQLAQQNFLLTLVNSLGQGLMTDSIKDLVSKQGTNIAPPGGPGGPGDIGGPGDGLNPPQFDRVPLLDSLSNVFGAESAPATTGTTSRTSTSNATLQALLAALGLGSNSAVGSFMNRTGTASSGTPSSATGTTAPRTTTTTPTPQIGTSYNALSSSQIQSQISQSPSLQAMNARIRALPAEQRAQYVPAERLPKGLLAQATPEEAMPGTVYYNYEPTNPKYFAYDGVGYREIQKRVAPTPGGGLGNYYYLPNGQRWA